MTPPLPDDTHDCPIDGCHEQVDYVRLMCYSHWRMVPPKLSAKLYQTWDRGRGAGTKDHHKAMKEAVKAVNELASSDASK